MSYESRRGHGGQIQSIHPHGLKAVRVRFMHATKEIKEEMVLYVTVNVAHANITRLPGGREGAHCVEQDLLRDELSTCSSCQM